MDTIDSCLFVGQLRSQGVEGRYRRHGLAHERGRCCRSGADWPRFVQVCPLFKSDVSALDGIKEKDDNNGPDLNDDGTPDGYTTNDPCVNGVAAKDYRRGMVAFKILGYRIDPARPYPYLPNLIIKIVNPAAINLDAISAVDSNNSENTFSSGGVHNVRLAK